MQGVHCFLKTAEGHKQGGFMCCPCRDCKNEKEYSSSAQIQLHLLRRGFMPNYICWTKHGERGVLEDEEEEDDDPIRRTMFSMLNMGLQMMKWVRPKSLTKTILWPKCCMMKRKSARMKRLEKTRAYVRGP